MAIRRLECCVCGGDAGRWAQWWNRDTGYGVCVECVRRLRARGTDEATIRQDYGVEGVNFGKPEEPVHEDDQLMTCSRCGERMLHWQLADHAAQCPRYDLGGPNFNHVSTPDGV